MNEILERLLLGPPALAGSADEMPRRKWLSRHAFPALPYMS